MAEEEEEEVEEVEEEGEIQFVDEGISEQAEAEFKSSLIARMTTMGRVFEGPNVLKPWKKLRNRMWKTPAFHRRITTPTRAEDSRPSSLPPSPLSQKESRTAEQR